MQLIMQYKNEKLEPYVEGEAYFIINSSGDKLWCNAQGQIHREDGPAVENASGTKCWYFQGLYHREDGPAIEWDNGTKEWWFHGQRHREDGPAIEYFDGYKWWYIEDTQYSESEYEAALEVYCAKVGKKSIFTLQREAEAAEETEEEKRREYWRTVEMPGEYSGIEL